MGCDIHLVVEKRVNGTWERVAGVRENKLPPRTCSWCDGRGHYKGRPDDKCYWCSGAGKDRKPYKDRNYTVFGVLAGVRNRNVTPIADPRGLPKDCTRSKGRDEDGDEISGYEYGDHSFSWLTLAELLAHDWGQGTDHGGWVSGPVYQKWNEDDRRDWPDEWCGMVGGALVKRVSELEMQALIAKGEATANHYTQIVFTKPLSESCGSFIDFMESLRAVGEPEDVRIVFGFDS